MEALDNDLMQFGATSSVSKKFDASQYAFFSNDVVEEVELGGLDNEEEDIPPVFEDEVFQFGQDKEEGNSSLLEVDDFANTYSKLNRVHSGPPSDSVVIDKGSREWSSASGQAQEVDFPNWSELSSLSHPSRVLVDSKQIYRTSSYTEQQQQFQQLQLQPLNHQYFSEHIGIPKSFSWYPSSGSTSHESSPNNRFHYPNIKYPPSGHNIPVSSSDLSHFPSPQLQMNAGPTGLQFGGNRAQLNPPVPRMQSQFVNQNGLLPGDHTSYANNLLQQRLSHQDGLMPAQLIQQQKSQQPRAEHQFQQSYDQLSGLQPQLLSRQLSSPPSMGNNLCFLSLAELSNERSRTVFQGRYGITNSMHSCDKRNQKNNRGWARFRSKYMTADEIENILRMQLAATQSNDPYFEDYYHQACLAKKSAGAKMRHRFCPINLLDNSSRTRPSNEPHPFLQVDALGRVSFSSISRPRPLLEVEPPNKSGFGGNEQNLTEKPLEQEPMLAARVTIEDGLCLLLDIDDIDRYLELTSLHDDDRAQLRRRRQVLLAGLASSLQLVDPLGINSQTVNLDPNVDLVFLRLVYLPKGRKLLTKYLELLYPGDDLVRVVCMAIFRHLRLLFGVLPTGPGAVETSSLARTVSICLCGMELKSLAACLASVVCSTEHPPLRPIESPAGGGASVILKSLLERATEVLRDPRGEGNCTVPNRAFWQASFNDFFGLLTKYCFNKYDTIIQSFLMQSPSDITIESDAARAIRQEMPVELLRACLPHTNEQQKKLLLDFAHRTVPVTSINQAGGAGGM